MSQKLDWSSVLVVFLLIITIISFLNPELAGDPVTGMATIDNSNRNYIFSIMSTDPLIVIIENTGEESIKGLDITVTGDPEELFSFGDCKSDEIQPNSIIRYNLDNYNLSFERIDNVKVKGFFSDGCIDRGVERKINLNSQVKLEQESFRELKSCKSCGSGFLNVCGKDECLGLGNCLFAGGECESCSTSFCENYLTRRDCIEDTCGFDGCKWTPEGCVDQAPDHECFWFDSDLDTDVDIEDYQRFKDCRDKVTTFPCKRFDYDEDGDIDGYDEKIMQGCGSSEKEHYPGFDSLLHETLIALEGFERSISEIEDVFEHTPQQKEKFGSLLKQINKNSSMIIIGENAFYPLESSLQPKIPRKGIFKYRVSEDVESKKYHLTANGASADFIVAEKIKPDECHILFGKTHEGIYNDIECIFIQTRMDNPESSPYFIENELAQSAVVDYLEKQLGHSIKSYKLDVNSGYVRIDLIGDDIGAFFDIRMDYDDFYGPEPDMEKLANYLNDFMESEGLMIFSNVIRRGISLTDLLKLLVSDLSYKTKARKLIDVMDGKRIEHDIVVSPEHKQKSAITGNVVHGGIDNYYDGLGGKVPSGNKVVFVQTLVSSWVENGITDATSYSYLQELSQLGYDVSLVRYSKNPQTIEELSMIEKIDKILEDEDVQIVVINGHGTEEGEFLSECWESEEAAKNRLKKLGADGRIILESAVEQRAVSWFDQCRENIESIDNNYIFWGCNIEYSGDSGGKIENRNIFRKGYGIYLPYDVLLAKSTRKGLLYFLACYGGTVTNFDVQNNFNTIVAVQTMSQSDSTWVDPNDMRLFVDYFVGKKRFNANKFYEERDDNPTPGIYDDVNLMYENIPTQRDQWLEGMEGLQDCKEIVSGVNYSVFCLFDLLGGNGKTLHSSPYVQDIVLSEKEGKIIFNTPIDAVGSPPVELDSSGCKSNPILKSPGWDSQVNSRSISWEHLNVLVSEDEWWRMDAGRQTEWSSFLKIKVDGSKVLSWPAGIPMRGNHWYSGFSKEENYNYYGTKTMNNKPIQGYAKPWVYNNRFFDTREEQVFEVWIPCWG